MTSCCVSFVLRGPKTQAAPNQHVGVPHPSAEPQPGAAARAQELAPVPSPSASPLPPRVPPGNIPEKSLPVDEDESGSRTARQVSSPRAGAVGRLGEGHGGRIAPGLHRGDAIGRCAATEDSPPGAAWTSVELRSWMPWNSVRWMTRWPAAMTPGAEVTGAAAGAGVGSL
jgi:hypothetical protein